MRIYHNLYFTTCTILNWYHLLKENTHKDIIIDSFRYLSDEGSVNFWAFVIMPNHFHVVWQINEPFRLGSVRKKMLRYTANSLKTELRRKNPKFLEKFKVNKPDREYQIWKRAPLSIEIYSKKVLDQKVNYIHNNPCHPKARLAKRPEDYKYSSASFYVSGKKDWAFLTG